MKVKKKELILVGVVVAWAYVSCTEIAVNIFYFDWIIKPFGDFFQFFLSFSNLYDGDKQQPMLFFLGLFFIFPYFLYVLNGLTSIDCVKVNERKIDFFALYMIADPVFLYFSVNGLLQPIPADVPFTLKMFLDFSLKSKFYMALLFAGGLSLISILIVVPVNYLKCLFDIRKGDGDV